RQTGAAGLGLDLTDPIDPDGGLLQLRGEKGPVHDVRRLDRQLAIRIPLAPQHAQPVVGYSSITAKDLNAKLEELLGLFRFDGEFFDDKRNHLAAVFLEIARPL